MGGIKSWRGCFSVVVVGCKVWRFRLVHGIHVVESCHCIGVFDKWSLSASSSTIQVLLLSNRVLCLESRAISFTVGILKHRRHEAATRHWCYVDWTKGDLKADHNPFCWGDFTHTAATASDLGQHPRQWLWPKATVSWSLWWKVSKTRTVCPRCVDKPKLWIWIRLHCTAHFGTVESC